MKELQLPNPQQNHTSAADRRSNVDMSRPFRSVKEAVAILDERFQAAYTYSPKPFSFPKKDTPLTSFSPNSSNSEKEPTSLSHNSHDSTLAQAIKKLELELDRTKAELKLLKERESETGVTLATLNAELHRNMSKLARAEAIAAKGAAASLDGGGGVVEEKKRVSFERIDSNPSPSLAQVLSVGEKESLLFLQRKKDRKLLGMKKKPVIPLVGELFSRKKGPPTNLHYPFHV